MSLRRQRPGAGSSHAFIQERTATNPWPDLRAILQGIPWAVVGGVATRAYMPERMTRDLDILVRQKDANTAIARLQNAGYELISQLAVPGCLLHSPSGFEVDVRFGSEPWIAEALAHTSMDAAGYPVLGLPYLVLMKLNAMRAQDWADVSRMLGWADDAALAEVRRIVAQYSPEDSQDLESLIFIGQQERG